MSQINKSKTEKNNKKSTKKQNTIVAKLLNILAPTQYKAQKTMDDMRTFLEAYTLTTKNAQKELDFIRIQSDKFGYDFEKIARTYTYEFYPTLKRTNFNNAQIHNLLIALVEYANTQKANSETLSKLLSEVSDNIKEQTRITKKLHQYSIIKNFNDEINETLERSTVPISTNAFYNNLAGLLHYKYKNHPSTLPQTTINENKQKNKVYDENQYISSINNLTLELIGLKSLRAIFSKSFLIFLLNSKNWKFIISTLLLSGVNKFWPEITSQIRNKNDIKYDYNETPRNIFTLEEKKEIFPSISALHPTPHLIWKQGPVEPNNELTSLPLTQENFPKKEFLKQAEEFKNNPLPEITENIVNTKPSQNNTCSCGCDCGNYDNIEFENKVREIMSDVFDEYSELKGYSNETL